MKKFDEYILGLLKKILGSYQTLDNLKDKPGDLETIKKELGKINGLIQVLVNKLENSKNNSDDYVALSKSGKFYLENNDFSHEIDTISKLYSEDPGRLRNIRYSILNSLNEKKFLERIETIIGKTE